MDEPLAVLLALELLGEVLRPPGHDEPEEMVERHGGGCWGTGSPALDLSGIPVLNSRKKI